MPTFNSTRTWTLSCNATSIRAFTLPRPAPPGPTTSLDFQAGTPLFGPETRGLPVELLDAMDEASAFRIPMLPHSRSLNLSNAVAVVAYEGCGSWGFLHYSDTAPDL